MTSCFSLATQLSTAVWPASRTSFLPKDVVSAKPGQLRTLVRDASVAAMLMCSSIHTIAPEQILTG